MGARRPARGRTRTAGAAVLASLLTVVVAGCSGGGSSDGVPSLGPGTPAAINTHVIQRSSTPGGTLRVVGQSDCPSWDPARAVSGPCRDAQRLISRQLVTYAAAPGPARLVGDLATAVPTSSDDMTWTYHLRPGLFFSDGERLTAADVKYAMRRLFASTPVAGAPATVRALLTPARPDPRRADPLPTVTTPDALTVTFHLSRPFADFNDLMATPVSTPVPPAADSRDYGVDPVSSGPYLINYYAPGRVLTLTRNPRWDADTDSVRAALPDLIEMTFGLTPAEIDSRLLDDAADLDFDDSGVLSDLRARLEVSPPALTARTGADLTDSVHYLAVVTTSAPFGDINCRDAVAWAVDRGAVQTARGEGAGTAATTLVSPATAGYRPIDPFPSPGGRGDRAAARAALKRCPSGGGIVTKLASPDLPSDLATAQAVSAALATVGIIATVVPFPAADYATKVLASPETLRTRSVGLALGTATPGWDSAYAQLAPLVAAPAGTTPSGTTPSGIAVSPGTAAASAADGAASTGPATTTNPAGIDGRTERDTLAAAMKAGGGAARDAALTRAQTALLVSAAYIPLAYDRALSLYSSRLSNVYYAAGFGAADLAAVGVVP
jgi:peptide/nickel transport system substrate-binding protein